jgi:atypical dual specificity phosphatase
MVGRAVLSNYRGPTGFHWIVPGRLAGCAETGVSAAIDYDLELLHNMGVTHLITLTEMDLDQNALARNQLSNLHLPIHDREAPSMAQTYMLVRRMQVLLDQGWVLSVHCHAGIGRTGTILAAWLIREGGLSASHAIKRLRTIYPAYVQTQVQEQFLQNFEQDIMRRM